VRDESDAASSKGLWALQKTSLVVVRSSEKRRLRNRNAESFRVPEFSFFFLEESIMDKNF
jgi:hypothetical protein